MTMTPETGRDRTLPPEGHRHWREQAAAMLDWAIRLLLLAGCRVTPCALKELIDSAPTDPEAVHDPRFRATSSLFHRLVEAEYRAGGAPDQSSLDALRDYWFATFAALDPVSRRRTIREIDPDAFEFCLFNEPELEALPAGEPRTFTPTGGDLP